MTKSEQELSNIYAKSPNLMFDFRTVQTSAQLFTLCKIVSDGGTGRKLDMDRRSRTTNQKHIRTGHAAFQAIDEFRASLLESSARIPSETGAVLKISSISTASTKTACGQRQYSNRRQPADLVKPLLKLAINPPTLCPFCAESWYVSIPMIIVFLS